MEEIDGLGIPLRSLWPTLHCRRVAGVRPLLSIGWWYLSLGSSKRHCCRVSAADNGCRVYPLDSRPDAVALDSGCTSGKRRAWFLPDDQHLASLVGLRDGWRHARTKAFTRTYGSNAAVPGSCGHGIRMVKVTDSCQRVMSSSLVPLKTRCVVERCTLNLPRTQMLFLWCSVEVRRWEDQLRCCPSEMEEIRPLVVVNDNIDDVTTETAKTILWRLMFLECNYRLISANGIKSFRYSSWKQLSRSSFNSVLRILQLELYGSSTAPTMH
ncbi:uncharacterized protein TNCV_56531 [Trichonephila clavipes]|nr:uncharacterized protein TNCV_56531 [Trichonephila clavipes]